MGDHYKTYQPPLALTDEDDAYVSVNSPSILATSSIAADEDDSLLDEEEEEPAENESIDSALLEKYLNRPLAVTDYDEDDELIEDDLDVGGKGKGKSTTLKRKGKVKAPSSAKKGGKKAPTMVKAAPNTKKRKAEEYTSDSSLSEEPVSNTRMTARQRAILTGVSEFGSDIPLELPDERTSKRKIYTAEELALRKSETARRRKHQADAKAEEQKQNIFKKLLKKQGTKKRAKEEEQETDEPAQEPTRLRYVQSKDATTLSFPMSIIKANPDLLRPIRATGYPNPRQCSVGGCVLPKRYRHARTGRDVCSLEHYRMVDVSTVV